MAYTAAVLLSRRGSDCPVCSSPRSVGGPHASHCCVIISINRRNVFYAESYPSFTNGAAPQDLGAMFGHLDQAWFMAAAATKAAEEIEYQQSRTESAYAELFARFSDQTAASSNTKAEITADLARSRRVCEVGVTP